MLVRKRTFFRIKHGEKTIMKIYENVRGRVKTMRCRSYVSIIAVSKEDYRENESGAIF